MSSAQTKIKTYNGTNPNLQLPKNFIHEQTGETLKDAAYPSGNLPACQPFGQIGDARGAFSYANPFLVQGTDDMTDALTALLKMKPAINAGTYTGSLPCVSVCMTT